MSNGYYRLARVETGAGILSIDEGWGGYADFTVSFGTTEISLTREQYSTLLHQMNEYATSDASRWTAQRLDALANRTGPTGIETTDDLPF